jgi:hypothetical protein
MRPAVRHEGVHSLSKFRGTLGPVDPAPAGLSQRDAIAPTTRVGAAVLPAWLPWSFSQRSASWVRHGWSRLPQCSSRSGGCGGP